MNKHFSNSNNKEKVSYDNFQSAELECNKYNSNIENLGKKKRISYLCKICNKIHIGSDFKKIITFQVQKNSLKKVNESISKNILIKKITI